MGRVGRWRQWESCTYEYERRRSRLNVNASLRLAELAQQVTLWVVVHSTQRGHWRWAVKVPRCQGEHVQDEMAEGMDIVCSHWREQPDAGKP